MPRNLGFLEACPNPPFYLNLFLSVSKICNISFDNQNKIGINVLIAIIGGPNKGKSTLFNALTLGNAAVANYPFTTIDPNRGVAYASKNCPHVHLNRQCNPNNSKCEEGVRKIPINVLDVAGLVEGAHEGKGMGNQFLSDVAASDCIILLADASGSTDLDGNPCTPGSNDVLQDIEIIETELDAWYLDVFKRNALKARGKKIEDFANLLSGLKITMDDLNYVVRILELNPQDVWSWEKEDMKEASKIIRERTKPIVIAANKVDSEFAEKNVLKLKEFYGKRYGVFPIAADSELALRKANEKGMIKYNGKTFEITTPNLPSQLISALEKINKNIIEKWGSTGVQALLDHCVFTLLNQIVVYPVEDEVHFANHFGKVLPDAILLKNGSKSIDLAGKIHSDLATHMLHAVDAEKKMRIAKDAVLHDGQVVKIVSTK